MCQTTLDNMHTVVVNAAFVRNLPRPHHAVYFVVHPTYSTYSYERAEMNGERRGKRRGVAMDPAQRIHHHLAAARSTSRLDLSTWADRRAGDFLLTRVPRQVRQREQVLPRHPPCPPPPPPPLESPTNTIQIPLSDAPYRPARVYVFRCGI